MISRRKLAERIRARRRDAGLTQAALARRIGVETNSVWRWENGETMPGLVDGLRLAGELKVSPYRLFFDEERDEESSASLAIVPAFESSVRGFAGQTMKTLAEGEGADEGEGDDPALHAEARAAIETRRAVDAFLQTDLGRLVTPEEVRQLLALRFSKTTVALLRFAWLELYDSRD